MNRLSAWTENLGLNREGLSSALNFVKNVALLNVAGDMEYNFCDDFVKITDNIYSMGFPSSEPALASGCISLSSVSTFLRVNFPSKFMIWNLSDRVYDYSLFDNQVIEFKQSGYTTPPLEKIFAICRSIDGWLQADPNNIAVIHCICGRTRTISTIACYLTWIGAFQSTQDAIDYIFSVQNAISLHLVPSQKRYLKYFDRILSQDYPCTSPLHLDRIIINTLPAIEADGSCRPYVQIFKISTMLKTTGSNNIDEIPSYKSRDSVVFPIGIDLEGDILIRVRNASSDGTRVSLLRFTFYIGYIENFNFRCAKVDLDGALNDDRFSPEFHIDLVFSEAKSTKPALSSDFFSQISQRQVAAPSERGFSGQKTTEVIDDVNLAQAQLTTDVDALISDLGIDDDIDNLDDDTDQLLAQLQEEIQNENTSPDRPATTQKTKETELDAEINKLLASS